MMKRKRDDVEVETPYDDHDDAKDIRSSCLVPCTQPQAQGSEDIDVVYQGNDWTRDLLSQLPEGLLASVVSHLTLRNVVQTSVVSHYFKDASCSLSRLKFDMRNMLVTDQDYDIMPVPMQCYCVDYRQKFVDAVNQFLKFHRGTKLTTFDVSFCLGVDDKEDIDRWIRVALTKDVETLRLTFFCDNTRFRLGEWVNELKVNKYVLSAELFGGLTKLRRLHLVACKFDQDISADFNSLTSLTLEHMHLSKFDLQSMLQRMPKLKYFTLLSSLLPAKLSFGCLPFLKDLRIGYCFGLHEIELCNAALIKFHTTLFRVLKCNLSGAPNLTTVGMNAEDNGLYYVFTRLAQDYPRLNTLYIYSLSDWGSCIPEGITKFKHLKNLTMHMMNKTTFDILKLISILRASPLLRKLDLLSSCRSIEVERSELEFGEFVHKYLEEVHMSGHFHTSSQIEFIIYLLKSAPALKKLTIARTSMGKYFVKNWLSWHEGQRENIYHRIKQVLEGRYECSSNAYRHNLQVVLKP